MQAASGLVGGPPHGETGAAWPLTAAVSCVHRLVVRRLRSVQPQRDVLPTEAEHKQVQRHQVVLLEGVRLLAQGHSHDDPAGRLLRGCPRSQCPRAPRHSHRRACPRGSPGRAPRTSPRTPASRDGPKRSQNLPHRDLAERLCEHEFKPANETDNLQTLWSQPRMLCASSSVNNWKPEH